MPSFQLEKKTPIIFLFQLKLPPHDIQKRRKMEKCKWNTNVCITIFHPSQKNFLQDFPLPTKKLLIERKEEILFYRGVVPWMRIRKVLIFLGGKFIAVSLSMDAP
jgi:hypothetical protein